MRRRAFLASLARGLAASTVLPVAAVAFTDRPRQATPATITEMKEIDGLFRDAHAEMMKQIRYQATKRAGEDRRRMESLLYGTMVG